MYIVIVSGSLTDYFLVNHLFGFGPNMAMCGFVSVVRRNIHPLCPLCTKLSSSNTYEMNLVRVTTAEYKLKNDALSTLRFQPNFHTNFLTN